MTRSSRSQRGQALAESLLLLLVLVPVALALEQLMHIATTQHAMLGVVRYALMEQFFASTTTSHSGAASNPASDPSSDSETVSPASTLGASLTLKIIDQPLSQGAVPAWDTAQVMLKLAEPIGPGELHLGPSTAKKVEAQYRFAASSPVGRWLESRELTFKESLWVLTGTWQATNREQLAANVRAITVAGRLQQVSAPVEAVRGLLTIIEPSFERFCPGRIVLESVPEDRLPSSAPPLNDWRRAAC